MFQDFCPLLSSACATYSYYTFASFCLMTIYMFSKVRVASKCQK